MRRFLLILAVAIIGAAAYAWWNRDALVEVARQELERELERAFGQPAAVGTFSVSVIPPRLRVERILVGGEPQPLASLDRIDIRLAALSTLAEARPVAKITARSFFLDATRLPKTDEAEAQEIVVPAFRVGGVTVEDARVRFRMGDEIGLFSVATARAHVDSARLSDLVTATVSLKESQLQRASQTLDLGEIQGSGIRDADGITVQSASLTAPDRSIRVTGESATRHHVEGKLDLHDLVIIDDDFDPFSGAGAVLGELKGPLTRPVAEGSIEISDVRIAGRQAGDLTTHVHHEGETTRFENARLRGNAGEVRGTVVAKFRREIPVEGTLIWDVDNLEALLNKLDLDLSFDNQVDATTVIKGQFDPVQLDVSAEGDIRAGAEVAAARADANITADRTDVEFYLTQTTRTRISGEVIAHNGVLEGQADIETSDLSALSALMPKAVKALDLAGEGNASVLIRGTTSTPRFEGSVDSGPLSVAAVQLDRLGGRFAWTEDVLEIPTATLETQGGSAVLDGKIALADSVANDWRLELTEVDTDLATGIARRFTPFPDMLEGGHLTGIVACSGPWTEPTLRASLVADSPRIAGEVFARLVVDGEQRFDGWTFRLDATHTSDLRVEAVGSGSGDAVTQISLSTTPVDLGDVQLAKRFGITGTLDLKGRLTGNLTEIGGELELSARGLAIGREEIGEVELHAIGEKGSWRIAGEAPAKRLSIAATAQAKPPFSYTARFDWHEVAIDYEASETDRLTGSITGSADFSGSLESLEDSAISIHVAEVSAQWGDAFLGLQTPIVITGQAGQLQIQPFTVAGKETSLRAEGTLLRQTELTMTLDGNASLDYLELLGEPFVSTDGIVDLDMEVRHSAARGWTAEGSATLERSVLDFGLPVAFTDATGRVTAHGRVLRIERLAADSGGGKVSLSGQIDLDEGPALSWQLSDVAVSPEPGIEAVLAGEGTLSGTWREVMLRGEIDVRNALYTRDFEIVDIPALFRPRIDAVEAPPSPRTIRLDLVVIGRGGLYVDNNVANVELSLDGGIKGTLEKPKIVGTVGIIGGEVKFRRRTFTLTGGAADFQGRVPPNPGLNINAETEITTRDADYLIDATVTGTARDPVVNFTSDDPSLTQSDIVSLVAIGRTAAELQGETGGVSSVDALALVPTSPVEEQVTQLVGIDRFEIDLAQTNSQGDVSPGVTIGKNLTDRFRAALTTTLDLDTQNAVQLEYDLTRRISLIGMWEADTDSEAGAFGGGVRMRYEFRRLPLSLLRGWRSQTEMQNANNETQRKSQGPNEIKSQR